MFTASAPSQCDQKGQFLKVICNYFACKSIPKTLVTFGAILKSIPLCKNCCGIYLGNFWKHLGYIFTPISGHTSRRRCLDRKGLSAIFVWKFPSFEVSKNVFYQMRHHQCDQMAVLTALHLAIYTHENLPNGMKLLPN